MADKFIPFNPETAKNGDTVYVNNRVPYVYVGPDAYSKNAAVIQNERGYAWNENKCLTVKAPKKTVWVNVYKDGTAFHYPTEAKARQSAKGLQYIDTYPIEIDDVA